MTIKLNKILGYSIIIVFSHIMFGLFAIKLYAEGHLGFLGN